MEETKLERLQRREKMARERAMQAESVWATTLFEEMADQIAIDICILK